MPAENGLPDDVPKRFADANKDFTFAVAEPLKEASFDKPIQVGGLKPEHLGNVWAAQQAKANEVRDQVRKNDPSVVRELPPEGLPGQPVWEISAGSATVMPAGFDMRHPLFRLIGITGRDSVGKTEAARMIPGAVILEMGDPLYGMLEALTGIPSAVLRQPAYKTRVIPGTGKTVRELARTLGHEWLFEMVSEEALLSVAARRVDSLIMRGVVVICLAGIRRDAEAEFVRARGGEVWLVRKPGDEKPIEHASERPISPHLVDVTIDNGGSRDALEQLVLAAFERPGRA